MSLCPITHAPLGANPAGRYSRAGLRRLSRTLRSLEDLPYTAEEQRLRAAALAAGMSIPGVQPKVGAHLRAKEGRFEIVGGGGHYILKPQSSLFRNLPENEALTMGLAASAGIEVPAHGLVRSRDGSWTYFVRRFDRLAQGRKLATEDFAQLTGHTRETKYDSTMEQVAAVLDRHATFPAVEKLDFLRRILFCFLIGNEDMHLKNFSLIVRGTRVRLSPAYDLVNTTIILPGDAEELALPLRGKKRKLAREDLVGYFGRERLRLPRGAVEDALADLSSALPSWEDTIGESFLPEDLRRAYTALLRERRARLGL